MEVEECFIKIGKHNILKRVVSLKDSNPKYAIVLLHGIGDHSGQYFPWMKLFYESGAVFYTADLPGHGLSSGRRGHIGKIDEVDEIIEHLISTIEPSLPIFIYGHSLGAVLVLHYILNRNPKINGLILTSPWIALINPPGKMLIMMGHIAKKLFPSMTLSTGIRRNQLYHNNTTADLDHNTFVHGKISLGTFFQVWDSLPSLIENAPKLMIPTLIAISKNDTIADAKASEKFAQSIGKVCSFLTTDNEFHNIHLGENKLQNAQKIIDWINQILSSYGH